MSGFVLDFPGPLSSRALGFLSATAHRAKVDQGLTGDALRQRIKDVYGRSGDEIVSLLNHVQTRYGGLTYQSGYFDAQVTFSPVCEPEDPHEELEILYAVETGGSAGASMRADGVVEVGFDERGIAEFLSLDGIIECDAMFDAAGRWPASRTVYVDRDKFSDLVARLRSGQVMEVQTMPEATGTHTYWFLGKGVGVFLCSTWSELGLAMPPIMRIWGADESAANNVVRLCDHET